MSLTKASVTMKAVCAVRAENQTRLQDPFATRIAELEPEAVSSKRALDDASRGMFSRSVLLRSLWFAEAMRAASDAEQLVILSAGLDTRAMSMPEWTRKAVFSVDHPESQLSCRATLERAGVPLPPDHRWVPLDLASETPEMLLKALGESGFDRSLPTLVMWEGATYYLPSEAVIRVLERLAAELRHVCFVADFLHSDGYTRAGDAATVASNLTHLKRIGEEWMGYFEPSALAERLERAGFESVEIVERADEEQRLLESVRMQRKAMFFVRASRGEA